MIKKLLLLFAAGTLTSCSFVVSEIGAQQDMTVLNKSEVRSDEESLRARVNLNTGELHVEPGPASSIYEVDIHYSKDVFKPRVDFSRDQGRASLEVELEGEGKSFHSLGKNVVNLRLSPEVPLELESNSGVGESNIVLSGMAVRDLSLRSGVGETRISMLEPNRDICERVDITSGVGDIEVTGLGNFGFDSFRFRGGVGESKLDFSGEWMRLGRIEIEVGIGGVEILIPRDVGAEIRTSKGLFSDFKMEGFSQRGDVFTSDNMDRVEKVVKFEVRSGIGEVRVRWI